MEKQWVVQSEWLSSIYNWIRQTHAGILGNIQSPMGVAARVAVKVDDSFTVGNIAKTEDISIQINITQLHSFPDSTDL